MSKHINTLLSAIGFEEEQIKSVTGLAEDADFDPKPFVDSVITGAETRVKNNQAFWDSLDDKNVNEVFRKKIEAQQYGRAASIVRQKVLMGMGLTEDDFADLPEEERQKIETFIPKAVEKFTSLKASDKQLQAELIEARKKIEDSEKAMAEKETAITARELEKYNSEKFDYIVLSKLSQIQGLKVPAEYIADKVVADLKKLAHFDIERYTATPKQLDNKALSLVEGTKVLTLDDLIAKVTKDLVAPKAATGGAGGGTGSVIIDSDDKGGLKISSHVQKIIDENKPKA